MRAVVSYRKYDRRLALCRTARAAGRRKCPFGAPRYAPRCAAQRYVHTMLCGNLRLRQSALTSPLRCAACGVSFDE